LKEFPDPRRGLARVHECRAHGADVDRTTFRSPRSSEATGTMGSPRGCPRGRLANFVRRDGGEAARTKAPWPPCRAGKRPLDRAQSQGPAASECLELSARKQPGRGPGLIRSGAIRAGAGIARTRATGRVCINRSQHAKQGGTPAGTRRFAAATHASHGPRPDKTVMHRCRSLGIRLAHQTSPPNVDVPSKEGTRPPIRCAEKNPNSSRPPYAVLTPVPDVRGDHHRGGLTSKLQPKPSANRAPTRELADRLNHHQ
jgi:hypothetical protein